MTKTQNSTNRPAAKGKKPVPAARSQPAGKPTGKAMPKSAAAQPVREAQRPMADDVIATKMLRDATLLEKVYLGSRLNIILSIALAISIMASVGLALRKPDIRYFAVSTAGQILPLTALDEPTLSSSQVLTWVTNAITKSYTFSFANYRSELQAARELFTADGWEGFQTALQESGNLRAVIDNKFVTTAAPRGAPVIVGEGYVNGAYAWRIELPVLVTYQSGSTRNTQDLLVTAVVVRRSELEHPQGIGIAQIIAQ